MELKDSEEKENIDEKAIEDSVPSKMQEVDIREPSKRILTIRRNKKFFEIFYIFESVNTDDENVMFYLKEQTEKKKEVYSKMIKNRFNLSKSKTNRCVDRLARKGLIVKITECPNCGRKYKRIPEICENQECLEVLIRQQGLNSNKLKYPHFVIKTTEAGEDFVKIRFKEYYKALRLYEIRINNIRQKISKKSINE